MFVKVSIEYTLVFDTPFSEDENLDVFVNLSFEDAPQVIAASLTRRLFKSNTVTNILTLSN